MLFLSLILVQIIIFAVLVLFLRLMITRNVSHATDHLNELNQDYTQKLDEAKAHQQEADKYYDETLLKAKVDTEKLKAQILREAHDTAEAQVNDSRKQSAEIIEQANKTREMLLKEIEQKIDAGSLLKACELVESILPHEISQDMHNRWVAELSKNGLSALKRLNLPEGVSEAQIISAYPLSAEQRSLFEKKFREELGRAFKLSESVDPALIAGVRIRLGSVAIDGSLNFKITEAVRLARSKT